SYEPAAHAPTRTALVALAASLCFRRRACGCGGSHAGAPPRLALGVGRRGCQSPGLGGGRTVAAQPATRPELDSLALAKRCAGAKRCTGAKRRFGTSRHY